MSNTHPNPRQYNRKKRKKKIGCMWIIPFIFLLFCLISVAGIYFYYDYHLVMKQQNQFQGMAKAAAKIVAEADSQETAQDYLNTLLEQTTEHTSLHDLSGKVECENGADHWNNGDQVLLSLQGKAETKNPFLKADLSENKEIAISSTCDHITMIPPYIQQTGIKGDYTNYVYFYSQWHNDCAQRPIADAWDQAGRPSSDGIATLNGYYLVAVRPLLGDCGDILRVVLEDGTTFDCMVADEKGIDAENTWGHLKSGNVSLIEFEVIGNEEDCYAPDFKPPAKWSNKKVCAIINYRNVEPAE